MRVRYIAQSIGQSDGGSQWWLNWVVKLSASTVPVGFVQAAVRSDGRERVADIARVISPRHQGQGIASEPTQMMCTWLRSNEVNRFVAYIHPHHDASMAVARRQRMEPTTVIEDGELRWES